MNLFRRWWLRRHPAAVWPPEHAERLAVTTIYPGTATNPATTQWPESCTPGDPCRVKFSNEADRGEWYDCPAHQPRGRHRIRPALYAVVTDVDDGNG